MPQSSIDVVNQSGFPLQLAAANEVREIDTEQSWRVAYSEHAWSNENDNRSGFIDLVVKNKNDTCILVIECKRVQNTSWVFLCNSKNQMRRLNCKAWITKHGENGVLTFGWHDVQFEPSTPECEFCTVRGESPNKNRPMLESLASEVVSATEAFAFERSNRTKTEPDIITVHVNVILTTAKLEICQFDVNQVSLANGKVGDDAEVTEVPFVRFRKQLSVAPRVTIPSGGFQETQLANAKENTVLVVNSKSFGAFLSKFAIDRGSLRPFT